MITPDMIAAAMIGPASTALRETASEMTAWAKTTTLDGVRRIGDCAVAAIVETSVSARRVGRGVLANAEKRPAAILIAANGEILAFSCSGAVLTLEDLERRFPGMRAEFERLAERK